MDAQLQELRQYLQGDSPAAPAPDVLRGLMAAYPYFAAPVAAMLRLYGRDMDPAELSALRSRLGVMLGGTDPAMRATCGLDDSSFYPDATDLRPDTSDALDTFFATYGKTSPEEEALLERLIFNPVPDYADLLAHEEGRDPLPDPDDGMPDIKDLAAKLARHEQSEQPPQPAAEAEAPAQTPVQAPQSSDDSLLSESLAKIFIKQGRYERAYEIISNLNLNYPEKSVYFADQLRFLRKLILIQKKNNHK